MVDEILNKIIMKTGIGVIADERTKQILKHGFTGEHHANHPEWYEDGQLCDAAQVLVNKDLTDCDFVPRGWNKKWFKQLMVKSYEDRLAIAGAFIAAEYDRLQCLVGDGKTPITNPYRNI